jgi:type IV secretory pathway component VirB8
LDTAIVFFSKAVDEYEMRLKEKNMITALQKESLDLCKGENNLKDTRILTLQGELVIQKNKHKRTIWTIIIVALTLSLLR